MLYPANFVAGLSTKGINGAGLFFHAFQTNEAENSAPWWLFWLLIIIGLIALAISWLIRQNTPAEEEAPAPVMAEPEEAPAPVAEEAPAPVAEEAPAPMEEETPAPVEEEVPAPPPDDLKRIEGIGPKISSLLQAAGITTFNQLATTEVDRLQAILDEAKLRLANPDTWPEQARLAAAGDWEALEKLQDELKGGRRVS